MKITTFSGSKLRFKIIYCVVFMYTFPFIKNLAKMKYFDKKKAFIQQQ